MDLTHREQITDRMEMFDMTNGLCGNCRKVTDYTLHSRISSREINGMFVQFSEKYATCNDCGYEVKVQCIDDENTREFESVCDGLRGCGLL